MTSSLKIRGLARALAVLAALVVAASVAPATAKDKQGTVKWDVDGKLIGKKKGDEIKKSKDISGIACATDKGFPRTCVVIDDDLQEAQIVTLTDGTIAAEKPHMIKLIDDKLNGEPVSLDGEGVAFADGYFYVIGSHGRPRSDKSPEERKAGLIASSKLIRFKLNAARTGADELAVSTKLAALIAAEHLFDADRDKELEKGGLTIEGIAVRDDLLFAGFRGPTVGKNKKAAVIMSAALGHFFDGKPANAKFHQIKLGNGRGVRDLAPYENGILILAGPVTSNEGVYSVLRWDGKSDKAKVLFDLPPYRNKEKTKQWKPEALLPLDRDKKGLRVLLLLDSAKNGKPRTERIPYP